MGQLDIKNSIEISASKEKIWKILADDFIEVSAWAPAVTSSKDNPDTEKKFDDAITGGRICEVKGFGTVHENIIVFDKTTGQLGWTAEADKVPGFVSDIQNVFTVESIGENSSRVSSHFSANKHGIRGVLMGGMMHKNFNKLIQVFLRDLKIYTETGVARKDKKKSKSVA